MVLLAVLGIAARNAILLIRHYQDRETMQGETFDSALVLRGSQVRVASTVLTALTTILALLPFVFLGNAAGMEIVRPMAVIMIGGLVVATVLNLFALPALYLRYGSTREVDLGLRPVADLPAAATD